MSNFVTSEAHPNGVITIELNRADKHNAFDDSMINQLTQFISEAQKNPECKVIVLQGQGRNFSAGADLNWMRKMANFSEEENIDDALALGKLMHVLYHSAKPTICAVQGKTFGGGIGLIACCHTSIITEDAQFCFSEAKLGIIPAVISPYIMNAIGPRMTRHLFLTARIFNAQQALQMGLAHDIVPNEKLQEKVTETTELLLQNGPHALQHINQLVNDLTPLSINEDLLQTTAELIAKLRVSPEGQAGLSAFLNKTKPNWNNS